MIEVHQSTAFEAGSCNACEAPFLNKTIFVFRLGPENRAGGTEIRLCQLHLQVMKTVAKGGTVRIA